MLVLLFHIGTERWAIAASDIKDVLPFVSLQTFAQGVDSAVVGSGLLNYRGEVMPAVDVSALVAGTSTPQLLSTRIAIVEKRLENVSGQLLDNSPSGPGEQVPEEVPEGRSEGRGEVIRLGLILDRASEMAQLAEMPSHFSVRSAADGAAVHLDDSAQTVGSGEACPSTAASPIPPLAKRRTYAKTLLRGQALSLGEPSGADVVPLLAIDQLSENMHFRGVS